MPEQAEPGVTFTLAPTTGGERSGPLLVIPLPTDARLVTAVMLAVSGWWQDRYGQPLRFGPPLDERDTPYGKALVLADPGGHPTQPGPGLVPGDQGPTRVEGGDGAH